MTEGMVVLTLEELERMEHEEERAEELAWDAVAFSDTIEYLPREVVWSGTEYRVGIVNGEPAFIRLESVERTGKSSTAVNIAPDNPSEVASGHDWLSIVDDYGRKTYYATPSFEHGFNEPRHDFDPPMVNPADRVQGQMWRELPLAEYAAPKGVCNMCNIVRSFTGNCGCN